ncbi:flagellar hook-basal body complex protein FliE [Acidipila sp. 4G-K13]|uniref:Flagellar hook-basal body complex protein FliE n=2 Tax=Paracidobacterium acidisoli TaxID=2303751 RepID=A0A372ISQ4_9BACT|nr:flagellar hook-basal body complex protein FliE [Paracidobacterium acidisoli]
MTSAVSDALTVALSSISTGVTPETASSAEATGAAMPFSGMVKDAVKNLNALEDQASGAVNGLLEGTGVDVHEAMIATQKADMSFELALAVRSKAVAAYQQVMGMQF